MSPFSRTLLSLFLLAALGVLAGCALSSPQDSSIPWNKPADWEGQIPGMGTNTH